MYRPARHRALQFLNGFENTQPRYLAGRVALSREGISPLLGLSGGTVPVLVDEQLGAAVNIGVRGQMPKDSA